MAKTAEQRATTAEPKVAETIGELTTQQQGGALAVVDFGEDTGGGLDNVSKDEIRLSFITLLQPLSPQCADTSSPVYNRDAKPGMFYDGSTGELFDGEKGIEWVFSKRDHNYVEMTPRNLGGGFLGAHAPDDPAILTLVAKQGKFGKLWTGSKRNDKGEPMDGTEFTETYYLTGHFVHPVSGVLMPAILPFKSTQIKKYQNFMKQVLSLQYPKPSGGSANPPIWAHRYKVTTQGEKNKKGSFFGMVVRYAVQDADGRELLTNGLPYPSLMRPDDPVYIKARDFFKQLSSGEVKQDFGGAAEAASTTEAGEGDDVPM